MLLTLLAFALPTAASATSVDFETAFLGGTMNGSFNTSISVTGVGSLYTMIINTGTLTKMAQCSTGSTCYDFSGGGVTVNKGGSMVFTDSLSGGITIRGNGDATISGFLMPNATVGHGGAVVVLDFSGHKVLAGSGDVAFISPAAVPEPSTLLSLATGVLGFAGMMRRKLNLRT